MRGPVWKWKKSQDVNSSNQSLIILCGLKYDTVDLKFMF